MASIDYWADAPMDREQIALFAPTLNAMIDEDDPVRLVDEVLSSLEWRDWETTYHGRVGQPPIHPRHLAAAILYGLYRRIRSSRQLEEATHYRLDFIWLLHGRRIDHTTLAKFRAKFREPLKGLFRQIGRIAMSLGLIRLCEVGFDGTRVKANNGRRVTRTAKSLEAKLAALDETFEQMLAELETNDANEKSQRTLDGQDDSPNQLPSPLAELNQRRDRVREALAQAQAADESRHKLGTNPEKNPAQVPTTDTDSRVMPNKEGGYAPNYTPTATTDSYRGFIVDSDVTADVNEGSLAAASVDRIEETFGSKPEKFLTDGGNNSGPVIEQMEERGVEFYAPAKSSQPQDGNPARRDDPTQPVAESQRAELPRNKSGQLEKSCFVYDAEQNVYYCPQGHRLRYEKNRPDTRGHQRVNRRVYRCNDCSGCPLANECVSQQNKRGRTITRDDHEAARERLAERMSLASSQELFRQRSWIAETPFGILKSVMGVRQFLLRGLKKVQTEWTWCVTAFNLGKLVREIARLRADFAESAAQPES
ncbi:MAG: IS1182 family transposase [Woeseiaceae bacterium]